MSIEPISQVDTALNRGDVVAALALLAIVAVVALWAWLS